MSRRAVATEIAAMLASLGEDLQNVSVEDTVEENIPEESIALDETTAKKDEEEIPELTEEPVATASESAPGVEDEIKDTAIGGDPTVQTVTEEGKGAKDAVSTDAEVFPTNSEYVAKVTKVLDRVASSLEKSGKFKLAFKLDAISDALEQELKK